MTKQALPSYQRKAKTSTRKQIEGMVWLFFLVYFLWLFRGDRKVNIQVFHVYKYVLSMKSRF